MRLSSAQIDTQIAKQDRKFNICLTPMMPTFLFFRGQGVQYIFTLSSKSRLFINVGLTALSYFLSEVQNWTVIFFEKFLKKIIILAVLLGYDCS